MIKSGFLWVTEIWEGEGREREREGGGGREGGRGKEREGRKGIYRRGGRDSGLVWYVWERTSGENTEFLWGHCEMVGGTMISLLRDGGGCEVQSLAA